MFRPRSIGLLLALVTLLVYLPATTYQFINYDDRLYVTENPIVNSGLTWAGVKWAFAGFHVSNWHPLTWLSHMTDCELFRLNPGGPHLVNILFHAVNTALLFALVFRLTRKPWPAAFVAALFAWHPLHVESVAWIAERKDVLSTFFSLLTLLSYARYVQENHRSSLWFALLFFALALLSKPMPVTLPLVMLLVDYWPLNRFSAGQGLSDGTAASNTRPSIADHWRSIFVEKWPFFLLSAVLCIITFLAQRQSAVASLAHVPLGLRLENVLTAYAAYLWKMVWPVDLAILYPLHGHIPWPLVAESAVFLAGVSMIVWRERKISPWLIVGWLWFLVTLLPVIGLVQAGAQRMADRYSYFPLIGIFLAIAFSAQAAAVRFVFLKRWFVPATVLILGACILLTENQLHYWKDSELLFTRSLEVDPSTTAHNNLGVALADRNAYSEALHQYFMVLETNPNDGIAYGNIGLVLSDEQNDASALIFLQRAADQNPLYPVAHENLGITLTKLKHYDEGMRQFSVAANLDHASAKPHFMMGKSLLEQGRDAEAVKELRAALQLDPSDLQMVILLANLLASDEDPAARNGAEALALAEKLVKQTGDQQPAALDTLAMADAEIGRFDEAIRLEQKAVKLGEANGPKVDLEVMQRRLGCYQQHKPWRESFKKQSDLHAKPVAD